MRRNEQHAESDQPEHDWSQPELPVDLHELEELQENLISKDEEHTIQVGCLFVMLPLDVIGSTSKITQGILCVKGANTEVPIKVITLFTVTRTYAACTDEDLCWYSYKIDTSTANNSHHLPYLRQSFFTV